MLGIKERKVVRGEFIHDHGVTHTIYAIYDDGTYEGELPPGLDYDTTGLIKIESTAAQTGDENTWIPKM